jgi:hypothetical protein
MSYEDWLETTMDSQARDLFPEPNRHLLEFCWEDHGDMIAGQAAIDGDCVAACIVYQNGTMRLLN